MSFLKAEWRNLILINYEVKPEILKKHVPFGTELHLYKGKCYLSLVGFLFLNTKVLGIKIPYHINFEEVNLRFYVKRLENNEWKRGVVFIKEIVPKKLISFVANTVYKENYQSLPMKHLFKENKSNRFIQYQWKTKNKWNGISVDCSLETSLIEKDSDTEFITEHYWGYARINEHKTNEYEVTHPRWKKYEVQSSKIDVDFKLSYGKEFEFLNTTPYSSIMIAEGSEITVEGKKSIKKND